MEDPKINLIEPLLERAEQYAKTSVELFKLRTLDKTAEVSSSIISRIVIYVLSILFVLTLTIAVALWLGEVLGHNYYGFIIVAAFYGILLVLSYFFHPWFKTRINNFIITELLH